jgi:hypothetical protein
MKRDTRAALKAVGNQSLAEWYIAEAKGATTLMQKQRKMRAMGKGVEQINATVERTNNMARSSGFQKRQRLAKAP